MNKKQFETSNSQGGIETLLKKWFIVLIVLSCMIFAVSSGCSESEKDKTKDTAENSDESTAEDTVKENEKNSPNLSDTEKVEIESTGNSNDWCPVGSSWKTTNPQTGEEVTMKVTGTENVDGVPMCKAVYETNSQDEDFSKVEYLWSEDGNTFLWTAYSESGAKISEFSMKDGKMRTVDKDGKVTEITQSS
jgi:hypothetical protein